MQISVYYKPNNPSILIQLFMDKRSIKIFLRKPLNKSQRVLKTYDDESVDLELTITDYMEIIPTIQRYIPHRKLYCDWASRVKKPSPW